MKKLPQIRVTAITTGLLLLIQLCVAGQVPVNRWQFTERASVNMIVSPSIHAKPGLGFDLGVSYRFFDHVAASLVGAWNDFSGWSPTTGASFTSASIRSLQLGVRYEHNLNKKFHWNVSCAAGSWLGEFFEKDEQVLSRTRKGYSYGVEAGLDTRVLRELQIGVFVKYQSYLPGTTADKPAFCNQLGTGISLQWWWW